MSTRSSILQSLAAVALNVESGSAPEWVELIPAGVDVVGRDGRRWKNPDPAALIAASDPAANPMSIDWEHATQVRAVEGQDAPAAAWIDKLETREGGAIWGHVDWTPRAAAQVANREYRFLSPVFAFDKTSGQIMRLVGAGLTNTPNLQLTALNRELPTRETSETHLDLATRLRQAFGLAADAPDDAIVSAATTSLAANRAGIDLTKFAPRADLDTAINRATTAETKLRERDERDHEAAIEAALDLAQTEGKITPASRPSYLAMCKAEGGLARFNDLAKTLPKIAGAAPPAKKPGAAEGEHGLTETELAVCRQTGLTPAEFAKSKAEA